MRRRNGESAYAELTFRESVAYSWHMAGTRRSDGWGQLENQKILICGAGIAGPTMASWLQRYGFEPTLIERAPALREGGYIVDFWGLGFDVAEKNPFEAKSNRLANHGH